MGLETVKAGLGRLLVTRAAAELADREGLGSLTLATLAAHLGVRAPSLYNHIDGLPGVRRELALMGMREMSIRLGRAGIGRARDEAVLALCEAYRAYVKEHPGVYAATQQAPGPEDKELSEASGELVGIVVQVMSSYGLKGEDALHAVRALRSVVHGFASLEVLGGFGLPLDLDESFSRLVRMLVRGLETTVGS